MMTWASRLMEGTDKDEKLAWDINNTLVQFKTELAKDKYTGGTNVVNERNVDTSIKESGDGIEGVEKKSKKFFRKRRIPKKSGGTNPVKPVSEGEIEKNEMVSEKYKDMVYDPNYEEDCESELARIYQESMDAEHNKEEQYYEKIERFYKEESPWNFAYIDDGNGGTYLTHYNEKTDSYSYQRKGGDNWGTPIDYSSIMWCPPSNWIKPVIYWDKIWSELDYKRTNMRRPYTYYPETEKNGIIYNAYIQFLKPRM